MIIFSGYKKALKVIDSCENEYHTNGAKKFINNFFLYHAKEEPMNRYGTKLFAADSLLAEMYERLLLKLAEKQATL